MSPKRPHLLDEKALQELLHSSAAYNPPYFLWIKILRGYLRMTQAELAERAGIPQSHVVKIESGQGDVQIGTLRKLLNAMACDIALIPQPQKPLPEVLRGRARAIALKRLKQSMGSMALEGQAPESGLFKQLLEKKTDEILSDPTEKLWNKQDE